MGVHNWTRQAVTCWITLPLDVLPPGQLFKWTHVLFFLDNSSSSTLPPQGWPILSNSNAGRMCFPLAQAASKAPIKHCSRARFWWPAGRPKHSTPRGLLEQEGGDGSKKRVDHAQERNEFSNVGGPPSQAWSTFINSYFDWACDLARAGPSWNKAGAYHEVKITIFSLSHGGLPWPKSPHRIQWRATLALLHCYASVGLSKS